MKIGIPVVCQNGHYATWIVWLRGLDQYHQGVQEAEKCACPKHDFGMGYNACGEPFLIDPDPDEALRKDAERMRWLRTNEFDIGSYHGTHEHNASAWFEHISDESIDEMIAEEAKFAKESGQ